MGDTTTDKMEKAVQDPRLKLISARIRKEGRRPESLIEVLHTAQNAYGHLPMEVLSHITRELRLPPSRVYSAVTFYHFFSLKPAARHTCIVCTGTACYVKGARALLERLQREFGVKAGEATADGALGVQQARCVGACGIAPVAILDDVVKGRVSAEDLVVELRAKISGT